MIPQFFDLKRLFSSAERAQARGVRIILSVFLGLIVVTAVIYYGKDLVYALRNVNLFWVMAGLFCYSVNYVLRAIRFYILSQKAVPFWPQGLYAACFHGFATYMMPFRSGEMTLPILLRSLTALDFLQSSRLLVRARLLDLQTLGAWLLLAALLADIPLHYMIRSAWFAMGGIFLVSPIALRWIGLLGERSGFQLLRWIGRFVTVRAYSLGGLAISAAIWAAIAGCFFCTARSIGIPLMPMHAWLLISIQLPMQILPVQGVANAGNHEGGWVFGLVVLGISTEAAIEFSLISHAIILFYVLALGPTILLTGYFCSLEKSDI